MNLLESIVGRRLSELGARQEEFEAQERAAVAELLADVNPVKGLDKADTFLLERLSAAGMNRHGGLCVAGSHWFGEDEVVVAKRLEKLERLDYVRRYDGIVLGAACLYITRRGFAALAERSGF